MVTNLFAFDASKTYSIESNKTSGKFMQDNGSGTIDAAGFNANSYWQFEATGTADCYYVKNATTGKYMQSTNLAANTKVQLGTDKVEICVKDLGSGVFGIASTDQSDYSFSASTIGANCNDGGYVAAFTAQYPNNAKSFWKVVEQAMPTPIVPVTPTGWTAPPVPGQNPTQIDGSTIVYVYNIEADAILTRGMNWLTMAIADRPEGGDNAEPAARQKMKIQQSGTNIKIKFNDRGDNTNFGQGNNNDPGQMWSDLSNAGNRVIFTPTASANYPNAFTLTNVDKNQKVDVLWGRGGKLTLWNGKGYYDWAFMTADVFTSGKLSQFKARKAMWEYYKALEKAGALDDVADALNAAKAVYTSETATTDDLRAAFRTLFLATANKIEDAVDVSYAFTHADISGDKTADGWSYTDFTFKAGEAEKYHAAFTTTQTKTDMPNGLYDVTVTGIFRQDDGQSQANPQLIVNGTSADFPNMNDLVGQWNVGGDPNDDWVNSGSAKRPNKMWSASDAQALDDAAAKVEGVKVRNNELSITFQVTGGNQWFNFQRAFITYKGAINLGLYKSLVAKIAEAQEYLGTNPAIVQKFLDEVSAKIAVAQPLTANSDESDLTAAFEGLNAALTTAKAAPTVANYDLLNATITFAAADGVDVTSAQDVLNNGTTNAQFTDALAALRLARRIANAEKDNNTYAGNEPVAGDFYLYNVGQKRFFCGGDDWGAHAAIGFPGIVVTLEDAGSGTYKINTHLPNGDDNGNKKEYLNFGGYCDTWTSDAWQFVEKGGGKYTIVRSNNANALLGYSNNTYNRIDTDKSGSDNLDNQWILVTKAQRDALYEAAAAVTDQPASAVDVSYMIKSPNFSQREDVSAWKMTGGAEIWGRGGNHPDFAIEAFDKTSASVEQTVSGLKPGTYRLKVQAFYRDGNFGNQVNVAKNGGELLQLATLYAGNKSALIQNVVNGANKAPGMGRASEVGNMPDGIDDACLYFQSGLYWATLDNLVVTSKNPSITFGARKTEKKNDGDWFVLDNFRLEYLGAYVDLSEVKAALQAKIDEANTAMTGAEATFLQDAVTAGEAAMGEMQDADVIVDATTALTTAINTYNAGKADLTALKQTVTKAQAEGISAFDNAVAEVLAADADAFAATAAQKIYDVRAARKVKALGKEYIYTGSAPAAGKFYLYNIGTGMFLGAGSDWNTHAAVDQVGLEVEMTVSGDGFTMKTPYGNFNGGAHGPYVDTGGNDVYTFTAVSGKENTYTIKQGELVIGWNPNADTDGKRYWNTIGNTAGADVADANYQWKLISADERAALEANASSFNAVDVSYKINNPSLNRKLGYDMWTKTGGGRVSTTDDNDGNRAADYAWEFFNTDNFSFTQTVTGLKPGYYKVSVQGFYRDGNGAYQAGVVNDNGELLQKAYLVGGNATALLPNVASAMDVVPGLTDIQATNSGNMPNWPNSSIEYFEHGAYLTTVDAKVGANGELTIGVKKDEKPHGDDWAVIDNFRLYYLGTPLNINTMSIVGDFTDWNFTDDKHMTQDATDPDVWTLTIDDFYAEGKKYEYKAAANDSWEGYKLPDAGNADFVFGTTGYPAGYYKLVFTVNTSTHNLTLDVTPKTVVKIEENVDYVAEAATDVTIELHRSLVANNTWNTFCVPFDISNNDLKAQFGDGVAVAEFKDNAEGENSTIEFNTMDTPAITANVPVLLKSNSTATSFVFGGDIVALAGEAKVAGTNFDFVGTFAASTTIEEGNYFMSANKLYKSAGATTIAGTRAYLKAAKAGARIDKFLLDGEDVTTSISSMISEQGTMDIVFDLQGRKVNDQTKKGVYIQNGKKVVVK